MKRLTAPASSLALTLCLVSGAGAQKNTDAFVLSPTSADAGAAFSLSAVSYRYNCDMAYSHQTVHVADNRIDLGFLAQQVGVICPAIYAPYGPSFSIPALAAGRYQVYVSPMAACQFDPTPCPAANTTEYAGMLSVGPSVAGRGWFIQPGQVKPNQEFTLNILSQDYGSCGTAFPHASISATGGRISASFQVTVDSAIRCIVDKRPFGPAFDMKGLAAGKYPVFVTQLPGCYFENPPCVAAVDPKYLAAVDTLVVAGATSVQPLSRGPDGRGQAWLAGGNLWVTLPGGYTDRGGPWRAEIATLSGRTVRSLPIVGGPGSAGTVPGAAGQEGSLAVPLEPGGLPGNTLYVVRLKSADGSTALPLTGTLKP